MDVHNWDVEMGFQWWQDDLSKYSLRINLSEIPFSVSECVVLNFVQHRNNMNLEISATVNIFYDFIFCFLIGFVFSVCLLLFVCWIYFNCLRGKFVFTTKNTVHKRLISIARCVRCELLREDVRKDTPFHHGIQ